jgi:putative SOS response-associated peptidase YedK
MCYTAVSITRQLVKYAKHRSDDKNQITLLTQQLEGITRHYIPLHIADAFAHPKLMVFTNTKPLEPQLFHWGLIPAWIKKKDDALKIANQTLNARGESIFEKPSYKYAALHQRCLIYLDAFYEYHHYKGKTYPFYISHLHNQPLAMAGLWEEWADPETGEIVNTVSLITTKANALLKKIHNNPKQDEARMPVILTKEKQNEWLNISEKQSLEKLLIPYSETLLKAHTVRKLKGKDAVGNSPLSEDPFEYPDLKFN